jgi:hypothetical protein
VKSPDGDTKSRYSRIPRQPFPKWLIFDVGLMPILSNDLGLEAKQKD